MSTQVTIDMIQEDYEELQRKAQEHGYDTVPPLYPRMRQRLKRRWTEYRTEGGVLMYEHEGWPEVTTPNRAQRRANARRR